MKRLAAAVLGLLAACTDAPPDAVTLYREAVAGYAARGNPDEAVALLTRAIEADPGLLEARLARGRIRARQGRTDDALADFTEVLRRRPSHSDALTARALLLAHAGRLDEALADADALVRAAPRGADGLVLRAWIHRRSARTAEAYRDFHDARDHNPDAWAAYYNAGVAAVAAAQLDDAERLFVCAAELDPSRADPHLGLGRLHLQQGRFEPAIDDFTRALERRTDADFFFHRAGAELALRRLEDAKADYDRAIHFRPSEPNFLYGRALAFIGLRDSDAALADLDACLAVDPRHRDALVQRGLILAARRRRPEAERDFVAALQILATPDVIRLLARVCEDKEDWARAVYYLESAVKLCTDDALRRSLESELAEDRKKLK